MNNIPVLPNEKKCTSCGNPTNNFETLSLREGGLSGFLSQMGEVLENKFTVNCYKCSKCGHLDFYEST